MKTWILIPARLGSSRLPRKPLADIEGRPMVIRVLDQCLKASAHRVIVATDSEEVAQCVEGFGYEAIMTRSDHVSGTDRLAEAERGASDADKALREADFQRIQHAHVLHRIDTREERSTIPALDDHDDECTDDESQRDRKTRQCYEGLSNQPGEVDYDSYLRGLARLITGIQKSASSAEEFDSIKSHIAVIEALKGDLV